MAQTQRTPPGHLRMLPIPTSVCPDLVPALASLAADRQPRVDVVIGPGDAGKSALLRHLVPMHRRLGDHVTFMDLSLHDWHALLGTPHIDVALMDHLDRLPESEHLRTAFTILDRVLPAMFSGGMSRLLLAISTDWRARFQRLYRISPEGVLRNATPGLSFEAHVLRPYTDQELSAACLESGLDPADFTDPSLRRPGVLAMASGIARDQARMNGSSLRDLLARRWIETANDTRSRDARRAVWDLMGTLTLRDDTFALRAGELVTALSDRFRHDELRAQEGGPLRWEGDLVQADFPAWGDVAAARALRTVMDDPGAENITRPVRTSVLQALVDLSDRGELATQVERTLDGLRGMSFAQSGYLVPVMGTLSAELSGNTTLTFEDLTLQGPDQAELRPVDREVAAVVENALLDAMRAATDGLLSTIRQVPPDTLSAYRGGYRIWADARRWASTQPLRASAEDAVLDLLPRDGTWRYEDILDVAVTGATTRLMAESAEDLRAALTRLPARTTEYLADVWDGVNDGAWDHIDSRSNDFIASLYLPHAIAQPLRATGCRLQRARLGAQDARGWRLIDCDLLLADFRSCRHVEQIDFAGSNWWSAILPPPARYHHSRLSTSAAFLDWCQTPPWVNPYYTNPWPLPFD